MPDPVDELALLHEATSKDVQRALARVVRYRGSPLELEAATAALGRLLARINSAADLLGRRRLLREARAAGVKFAAASFPFPQVGAAYDVPFLEAVESLLEREPVLAEGWEATRDAYEAGGFALAQAAVLRTTENVGATVAAAISRGIPAGQAEAEVRAAAAGGEGFTAAYSQTVVRTNVTSAYAAGRRAQARSPAIKAAAPAFRFAATRDSATRDNHLAADGMVAHVDDPVWNLMAPPLGYQCRCALELVPRAEAKREGVLDDSGLAVYRSSLPAGARPDPGFRSLG